MLSFVSNPFTSPFFLGIFMGQAGCLKIHVNTIMGDTGLKHFSYNDHQHSSPKSTKIIRLANDLCRSLIKRLPWPTHIRANCRLLFPFFIAFPDLLNSSPCDFHIQSNLFCTHSFLLLPNNPMDLALIQFHNSCYESIAKACAKYFQDSTSPKETEKGFIPAG